MDNKLKQALSLDDIEFLDAKSTVEWSPKKPRELLLPYISYEDTEELTTNKKIKKIKEVYEGYNNLEKECSVLKQQIEDTCKTVEVPLNPTLQLSVIDAIKRTFGTDGSKITFTMYKTAIEKIYSLTNSTIPKVK